ncbi:MAG TPA: hypothetical protein VJ827_02310 [Rubrobacter sp.]|nr:hypothetical protein [Rubrobacter sp.]
MSFILTAIGLILLVIALAGIAFGIYMAADPRTREAGKLCAIWWVPGVAAASGVLMRDVVTFTVGLLCFLVAGAVFVLEGGRPHKPTVRRTRDLARGPDGKRRLDSEKTTRENNTGRSGKAVS